MFKFILPFFLASLLTSLHAADVHPLPDGATHIIMIRHGETYRSAAGKEIQGQINDAAAQLNPKGQTQADQVGIALAKRYQSQIALMYTSPLGRCVETAKRIAVSFPQLSIVEDRRLMEICHGAHDTMNPVERNAFCLARYRELENQFQREFPHTKPDRFFKWKINPLSERSVPAERIAIPLNGELETIFQVFERATASLREIAQKHPGQRILVSSHQAVIKSLADEAEYRERGDYSVLPVYYEPHSSQPKSLLLPGNCHVYHFAYYQDKLTFLGTENLLQQ